MTACIPVALVAAVLEQIEPASGRACFAIFSALLPPDSQIR
jgi:hypothetical protein